MKNKEARAIVERMSKFHISGEDRAVVMDALDVDVDNVTYLFHNIIKHIKTQHTLSTTLKYQPCVALVLNYLKNNNHLRTPVKPIAGLGDALSDQYTGNDDGGNFTIVSSYAEQTHTILKAAQAYHEMTEK